MAAAEGRSTHVVDVAVHTQATDAVPAPAPVTKAGGLRRVEAATHRDGGRVQERRRIGDCPSFWVVTQRPALSCKSAIQNRFTAGNAQGA